MQITSNKKVLKQQSVKDSVNQVNVTSTDTSKKIINKKAVKASFSKAAGHYDQFADLQREIGHQLFDLMPVNVKQSSSILDLGCGTGYFSALLREMNIKASLTCFDLSPQMLQQTAQRKLTPCQYVEGDIDAQPFTAGQFNLIFSNLVLQWSEQLSLSLQQTHHALKNDGNLCFSTLLDGSLFELQQAWKSIDSAVHVNHFLSKEQVLTAVKLAGYQQVKIFTETRIKKYPDVISVLKALKGIGANHVHNRNNKQTSNRQLLNQLELGYQPFKNQDGDYNLSYQVCYIVAQK